MKGINEKYYKTVAEFAEEINERTEIIKNLFRECSNVSYREVGAIVEKSSVREENKKEVTNYINYNNHGFVTRTYSNNRGYTHVYSTPCGIF